MYPKDGGSESTFFGRLGILIALASLVLLLLVPGAGLIGLVLGVILAFAGRRPTSLIVCPACKHTIEL